MASLLRQLVTPVVRTILGQRSFHATSCVQLLDKDVRNKKFLLERTQAEKQDNVTEDNLDNMDFDASALTNAGITIPTLETHAMLIDGTRYDELPIIYIRSSTNNTIITVTDHTGQKKIAGTSCGKEGFKNARKSTNVAAQATGLSAGKTMVKKGVMNARVLIQGIGSGRLPSLKGVEMAGVNIVSLTDKTKIAKARRPRKPRRL